MDSSDQDAERKPCRNCGRKFNPESLVVHERICLKSNQKKRKVFDSTKQRIEGTDLNLRQVKQAQKKVVPPPKSSWRVKHADFMNTVRAARGVTVAMKEGKPLPPPPPPSINPDYIQCPYCQRRFNEKAAERHIPFCKEKSYRINSKPQLSATVQARQAARTQYQAPRPKAKTTQGIGSSIGCSTNYSPGARSPAAMTSASRYVSENQVFESVFFYHTLMKGRREDRVGVRSQELEPVSSANPTLGPSQAIGGKTNQTQMPRRGRTTGTPSYRGGGLASK